VNGAPSRGVRRDIARRAAGLWPKGGGRGCPSGQGRGSFSELSCDPARMCRVAIFGYPLIRGHPFAVGHAAIVSGSSSSRVLPCNPCR